MVVGLTGSALGQSNKLIDSLKNELNRAVDSVSKQGEILNELAFQYLRVNPDSALFYAHKAQRFGEKTKQTKLIAEAMNSIAKAYLVKNVLDSAIFTVDNAIELLDQQAYAEACATLYMTKGNAQFYQSNLVDAATSFEKSAHLYSRAGDTKKREGALLNMGTVLMGKEEFKRSKAIFEKLSQSSDPQVKQNAYSNLGSIAGFQGKLEESLQHLADALRVGRQYNLDTLRTKLNLAITNEKLGNDDVAIQQYEEAKEGFEKVGAGRLLGKASYNLAYMYVKQGEYEKALVEIELAERLLDTSNIQEWLELYNIKHEALKNLGDYEKAYESLGKAYQLRDSLFKSEKIAAVTEIETKYQTEQKELKNQALQRKNELKSMGLAGLLTSLVLVGVIAYFFYKQKQELRVTNTKINLLHRELSHRVKNNLAFVSSLMRMQGRRLESAEAQQAVKESEARVESMSLLHRKLYLKEDTDVDASNYLQELCAYLQDAFPTDAKRPEIEVEAAPILINGEDVMRIGLIVNELVTNAFKYAFDEQPEPRIQLELSEKPDGGFQLFYQDNGKGLPAEINVERGGSLGLKLIHTLTRQLDGSMEQYNEGGACFRFDFAEREIA